MVSHWEPSYSIINLIVPRSHGSTINTYWLTQHQIEKLSTTIIISYKSTMKLSVLSMKISYYITSSKKSIQADQLRPKSLQAKNGSWLQTDRHQSDIFSNIPKFLEKIQQQETFNALIAQSHPSNLAAICQQAAETQPAAAQILQYQPALAYQFATLDAGPSLATFATN